MKRKVKSSKGFTLVETVAAITVLTLVVAAVTASLIAFIRFNARTEQRLQAELAVSNAVERLLAEGYDGTTTVMSDVSITYDPDSDVDQIYLNGTTTTVGYNVTVSNRSIDTISVTAYVPAEGMVSP